MANGSNQPYLSPELKCPRVITKIPMYMEIYVRTQFVSSLIIFSCSSGLTGLSWAILTWGLSRDYCQMMAGTGAIRRLNLAGYPRWIIHLTGSGYGLSVGSLDGAVRVPTGGLSIWLGILTPCVVSGF